MIHLKRLCSYLKRYQTIYRSGEVNRDSKTEGNKQCNKENIGTQNTTKLELVSFLKYSLESEWTVDLFVLMTKMERWMGCRLRANSIGTTCIRFRSTLLSSVAHMNKKTMPEISTYEQERGLTVQLVNLLSLMQNFQLKNTNAAEDWLSSGLGPQAFLLYSTKLLRVQVYRRFYTYH